MDREAAIKAAKAAAKAAASVPEICSDAYHEIASLTRTEGFCR